jgi:hypothetical protein
MILDAIEQVEPGWVAIHCTDGFITASGLRVKRNEREDFEIVQYRGMSSTISYVY